MPRQISCGRGVNKLLYLHEYYGELILSMTEEKLKWKDNRIYRLYQIEVFFTLLLQVTASKNKVGIV